MTPAAKPERITVEDYLRMERASAEKHVYLDGRVFAMAGESLSHNRIAVKLARLLDVQLDGKPCEPLSKDVKVRSGKPGPRNPRAAAGLFSYPDVIVVCGDVEFHDEHRDVITNPKVIIEVLSPSTGDFDRGEKFARYQRWNPTLTDYLLVSQDRPRVEHFVRRPKKKWLYELIEGLDAAVALPSIGCAMKLADVYARVEFPADDDDDAAE